MIMRSNWKSVGVGVAVAVAWIGSGLVAVQAASEAEVTDFLARIQSDQGATRVDAIIKAGPMGAAAVVPLGQVAGGDNREASIAAQRALRNIAAYAGRPEAEAGQRKAVAEALTRILDQQYSKVTRCLALDLLSITGNDAVVPKIDALLHDSDGDVADEARRSLEGIPGSASLKALIDGAGKAQGRLRLAIFTSLGQRAAPEAAEVLIAATESPDTEVVLEALDALARIGIAKDDRVKMPSWDGLNESQQARMANSWLRWADQRAVKGAVEDALEVYRMVFDNAQSEHLICAALIGAAKAAPEPAFEYVVRALGRDENTVRMVAVRILEQSPGDDAKIGKLLDAYRNAKPDTRELIIRVLNAWNSKKLAL